MIDELLKFNREFVKNKGYERFITNKYPDKKIAIVSCMDTRLTELLPAIKNGDVKIIKNAGAIISHPFGSVIRSLLVAIYELGVNEVMIVGHTDCGAKHMDSEQMIEVMKKRGIPSEHIDMMRYCGIDFKSWLRGFDTPEGNSDSSTKTSVDPKRYNGPWICNRLDYRRIGYCRLDKSR
mgnify:CR=1 FL=1